MNNQYLFKIKSVISEIEKTNVLLNNFNNSNDIVDITIKKQLHRKKKNLFKELLTILLLSNLSINSYENLYYKILAYLKNDEEKIVLSSDFKVNIKKAEALLV